LAKDVFINIGLSLLAINSILLVKGFSTNGKPFKIFTGYSVAMCLVQLTSLVIVKIGMYNLFMSHFYFIFQFLFLSTFYYHLLKDTFQKNIIISSVILCALVLGIQYALDWSLFHKFNLLEIFITSLSLIIYSSFHLYNLLNEKKEYYYINVGLLIYLFGSTVVFLTANLLLSLKSDAFKSINQLNVYLYIVYQLFIMYEVVGIFLTKKSKKQYE
jgi:hypothetical protein